MSFVRFLMLLSLVVWIGGIIFFAFVVAPTVFKPSILPTHQLAGNVVSRSLACCTELPSPAASFSLPLR